jgi:hypothetical protein
MAERANGIVADASSAFASQGARAFASAGLLLVSAGTGDATAFCAFGGFVGGFVYGDGSTAYAIESALLRWTGNLPGSGGN